MTTEHKPQKRPTGDALVVLDALDDYARYVEEGGHMEDFNPDCEACQAKAAFQRLVEQLETARRHRLALAEWIVKNQPETTWSEEVQELAILLNDEHGKVFELQEQLEAAQRVVDAARIVSETEATGTLPDLQSLADALARYPAREPEAS